MEGILAFRWTILRFRQKEYPEMLKIVDSDRLEVVLKSQIQVRGYSNYLKNVLEPAIARGDWDELEEMPIGFDDRGTPLGCIKDDIWKLTEYFYPNQSTAIQNIYFKIDGKVLERNIRNEIKILILKMLWLSHKNYTLDTCFSAANVFKKFAVKLLNDGVNSFSYLSFERMEEWILCGITSPDFRCKKTYQMLNKLIIEKVGLPFVVTLKGVLKATDLGLTLKKQKQFIVVPPRLYFNALSTSASLIEELYAYRYELGELSLSLSSIPNKYAKKIHERGKIDCLQNSYKKADDFKAAFYAMESPTEQEVLALVMEYQPSIVTKTKNALVSLSFKGVTLTLTEANFLLSNYVECCKFLILTLTGMRMDELYALHWHDGIECSIIEGQEVYILRADMSKTTGNSQARQDTFVTTETGKKAYEILNEIMIPLRNSRKPSQQGFFHTLESHFYRKMKSSVGDSFIEWFVKRFATERILDADDMIYLSISDPEQNRYKLGDTFHVTPHNLRRSFAYYLVGYELLSFPQLKQQFSHFSSAMSRYYAKNSSKFQKWRKSNKKPIYDEVDNERVKQQAQIYLNIYQKLANNERVAGGKGKAFSKQMLSGNKANLFTDRTSNDMLSSAYWENAIRKKKRHLHVVAPGVICTSTNCSMRTMVSFLDCVDCDNDYVIDAVFAESNRTSAEINMLYDIENGELTPSSATESYKKIIAAQRIMDDLGVAYEPVIFPSEVKGVLVPFVEL